MGIHRYFTAQEVIACTGITYRRLDYWVKLGVIRASCRAKVRRGLPRLFTFRDIVEIRVAVELTSRGLRISSLGNCLKSIRKRLPDVETPLASEKLITDGRNLFRYVSELEAFEDIGEFGQFVFAFSFGEEVKAAVSVVNNMPTPMRYKRRVA